MGADADRSDGPLLPGAADTPRDLSPGMTADQPQEGNISRDRSKDDDDCCACPCDCSSCEDDCADCCSASCCSRSALCQADGKLHARGRALAPTLPEPMVTAPSHQTMGMQ
ncbi:hypothetical protein ABBQ32_000429 [Trebouxia sp. C0010 RCD-2024]